MGNILLHLQLMALVYVCCIRLNCFVKGRFFISVLLFCMKLLGFGYLRVVGWGLCWLQRNFRRCGSGRGQVGGFVFGCLVVYRLLFGFEFGFLRRSDDDLSLRHLLRWGFGTRLLRSSFGNLHRNRCLQRNLISKN